MLSRRYAEDGKVEAGLDEAGRGSFWGDLYAAAVIWPDEATWTDEIKALVPNIKDSKKVSAKKRDKIADEIRRLAVDWAVGSVTAAEIDTNGIQWANQEAFRRALSSLSGSQPERLLIDGVIGMSDHVEGREQHNIIDGDALYMSIAAASILAKVEHDRWVCKYCESNPECNDRYNLLSCKGYGTVKHREGLGIYGAHALHRRTFVRKYIKDYSTSNGGAGAPTITTNSCKIKI
jgi:ribonuclease HII